MSRSVRFLEICLFCVVLLWGSASAWGYSYEYSDAPGYGDAWHVDGTWQRLGTKWDREYNSNGEDSSDDGISWSTDGGNTWGNSQVNVGDSLMFRFHVTRAAFGTHDYDQLDAWVDWDGDQIFETDSETVMDQIKWDKGDTEYVDGDWHNYVNTHGVAPNPDAQLEEYFVSAAFTVPSGIDSLWLRARVVCNTSIPDGGMTPYGKVHQGEVEDYRIAVVPEPGTLMLLGCGLLGLAGFGRRRFNA